MQKMTRREFGKKFMQGVSGIAVATSVGATASPSKASQMPDHPNIVFVSSDQHAYKYAGYMGHPLVQTPHLDQIAEAGVAFTNNYTGSPVCVPGRTCMMTGTYASDNHSYGNSTVWDGTHPTWVALLRDAGYHTWGTGKTDLNDTHDIGFVEGETGNGHQSHPDITELFRRPPAYRVGERPNVDGHARDSRHNDADRTKNALDFIRNKSRQLGQPWLAFVGLSEPHPSFVALRKYFDYFYPNRTDMPNIPPGHLEDLHLVMQELRHFKRIATPIPAERIRRARAGYYGMISELDEYLGQIWQAVAETGQQENTLFIYTSDHGESLGEHGLWYKNNLYDVAARVPLVMAGGGLPSGMVVNHPVSHVDVVRTMLGWTGAKTHSGLRGTDLSPLLSGHSDAGPPFVYSENHTEGNITGSFMIRKGDWKYLHFTWYDDLLFNLKEDPGEFENRINDPAAQNVRKELQAILNSQVDTEAITVEAFHAEEKMLQNMASSMTEEEMFNEFKGRLGPGLAMNMVAKARGR